MTQHHTVQGIYAPASRLTPFGAALMAGAIAIPGGTLIGVIAWLLG